MLLFPDALADSFSESLKEWFSYMSIDADIFDIFIRGSSISSSADSLSVPFMTSWPLSLFCMGTSFQESFPVRFNDIFSILSISIPSLQVLLLILLLFNIGSISSQSSMSVALLMLDMFDIISTISTIFGAKTSKAGS